MSKQSGERLWRKLVKKLQRKRRRQQLASQRDKEIEKDEVEKLKDPLYKSWLEQQEEVNRQQQIDEENEHREQEELWLRRELLAQKQFKRCELKRRAEEANLEAQRLKQEEELKLQEEARKSKRNEIKLQAEKASKEFEDIMTSIKEYLEDLTMKTPTRLIISVESRPGGKLCEFFEKTNCCRFDPCCTFNHIRPMLAQTILIKHFFHHPLLEQQEHTEYSRSDSDLELNECDLREAYDDFCEDVWPVLEEFGTILNFRTVRNIHSHLRGHVFVEYTDKRSALKAFISLQNRYYASKRLNVEFSNIRQWHNGVCGMRSFKGLSLGRKCLKGDKCNFLHLMKNINNKYNQTIDKPERSMRRVVPTTESVRETPITSWNYEENPKSVTAHSRSWRWSESPEVELKSKNDDENFQTKTDTVKPLVDTVQRKSDSSGPIMYNPKSTHNTNERETSSSRKVADCEKISYKHKSKYLRSSHNESKRSFSKADTKHYKSNRSKDRNKDEKGTSSSQRRKNSGRETNGSDSGNHKISKKSRYNSPISVKKRKKSDRSAHP